MNTPGSGLTARLRSFARIADRRGRERHSVVRKAKVGPLDLEPVQSGKEERWCGDGTRSRRSAMRRPLTMPAERSERLPSVLQQNLARRGQGDGGRIDAELGQRAVEVHQHERARVVRARLPGGHHALNSTHGTSHPALPAAR